MEKLFIIKIGGNIIDDDQKLSSFLQSFALLSEKKILVHGGGKLATRIGDQLGIESKYVDGRRITDAATIDLVTMVYGGLVNKKIVAILQSLQCNAIGVSGADGDLVPANKRPVKEVDFGYVGDVNTVAINTNNWQLLLNNGLTPVLSPLTHDGKGSLLNTNADTMAQEIAVALSGLYEAELIYSFEKPGVLLDANDNSTVIAAIDPHRYEQLKQVSKVFAGMIPKLENAFAALRRGVKKIVIGDAKDLMEMIKGTKGTTIVNE